MKNLQTFQEFVNENSNNTLNPVNEAYTLDNFLEDSEGDDFWVKTAENILKYTKLKGKDLVWVTTEDEDDKWDDIAEYWDNEAKSIEDVSKKLTGVEEPAGMGSYWQMDSKIPMLKFEEQGIECYVLPLKVYNKL